MNDTSLPKQHEVLKSTFPRVLILFILAILVTGTLSAKPSEVSGGIGLSGSGTISELTGLAVAADFVFDLPYHTTEFDGTYAPIHSWQNFEGPSLGVLASQRIWQAGIGYRKVLRFFEFLPLGFGLSGGISTTDPQGSQLESGTKTKLAPFIKFDGTVLGIAFGMDVVLDSESTKKNGFLLGFRF